MKNKTRLFNLLAVGALFLGACNLPSSDTTKNAASTAAAETVQALLSATPAVAISGTPTVAGAASPTATLTPIPLLLTNTPAASATSNCNVAQFITDVTVPDGTVFKPSETFTKKWRVKNIGSCAWNGFALVFDSGDAMSGPASNAIAVVNPGQEVDLALNLTAPASVGTYRGYWRINTNSGVLVPIVSGSGGKSFYVEIKVQNAATATPVSPSAVPTAVFAVTGVTFNVTGTCPNFNYTYSVTTNGAGTVKIHRVFSDGGTDTAPVTMTFASAGTQTSAGIATYFGGIAGGATTNTIWTDIYIDEPNNQQFGRANFTCP